MSSSRLKNDLSYLLHSAIKNNDILTLGVLLKERNSEGRRIFNIEHPDFRGLTPLGAAIVYGKNRAIAEFLIKEGADLFAKGLHVTGTLLHAILNINDFDLANAIIHAVNDKKIYGPLSDSALRKGYLNRLNKDNKTIFCTTCEQFLKHKIPVSLIMNVMQWHADYDTSSVDRESLGKAVEKLIKMLKRDGSYWERTRDAFHLEFFKNFDANPNDRDNLLKLLEKLNSRL
jgi:ankyrin repeat protein